MRTRNCDVSCRFKYYVADNFDFTISIRILTFAWYRATGTLCVRCSFSRLLVTRMMPDIVDCFVEDKI